MKDGMIVWCMAALRSALVLAVSAALGGCVGSMDWLASSGPSFGQVRAAGADPQTSGIQVVELTDAVARRLLANQRATLFSETLGAKGCGGARDRRG